jgi:hypothetical protein
MNAVVNLLSGPARRIPWAADSLPGKDNNICKGPVQDTWGHRLLNWLDDVADRSTE